MRISWTEDAIYVDPLMRAEGHGHRFSRTGTIDEHNDRVRFGWELAPEGGSAVAGGVDFGEVAGGRLKSITGFLGFMPLPASGQ